MNRRSTYVKGAVLLALVIGAIALQLAVGLPDQAELRSVLDGLGAVAIPAYIALYAGVTLLPAGPTAVLTIVGGALLGFPVALACVLVGALLGASGSFFISRSLGREFVRGVSNERIRALDEKVGRNGFATVLVARLIPLVPFSSANYAFGVTSVTWPAYAVATAVGILPGTALYVAVGAYGATPGSWPFIVAVAGLVLLSGAGLVRARVSRGREARRDSSSDVAGEPVPE